MNPRDDKTFLRHIEDAAAYVLEHSQGLTLERFNQERDTRDVILHELQIIGEATHNLTVEFRQKHPEVPWHKIVGMRNRIVHAYFDLDMEAIWDTVQNILPDFLKQIRTFLEEDGKSDDELPSQTS